MQVFTGHDETAPLALMLKDNVLVNAPLDFVKPQNLMKVEELAKALMEIHAQVVEKATHDSKAAIQKHDDKTHVRTSSPNFQVRDYMPVAEHRKSEMSKLQVKWKGPRRVASVESDYVFVVESLDAKELKAADATRLRFYKDKELNVTTELAQAAEQTTISSTSCRKYSTRATINKRSFTSCWSRGAVSSLERPHLGIILRYGCGCSGDGEEVLRVSQRCRHVAQDAISLRVLMGKC
jgi:hypothetical protein